MEKDLRSRIKQLRPPVPAILVLFALAFLSSQLLWDSSQPFHAKVLVVLLELCTALAMFLFYREEDPACSTTLELQGSS